MRKYEAINLMDLYSKGNTTVWNNMLMECYKYNDIKRLVKIRYQIQAGMTDLSKKGLNHPEICDWHTRLCRSIEITAKKIIKKLNPVLLDNPLIKKHTLEQKLIKNKRDIEFAKFLKESAY